MVRLKSIVPLTEFQRNAAVFPERLERDGRPLVLTVNGRARAVIRSATAFDSGVEAAGAAALERALDEALRQADAGLSRPIEEVQEEFRRRRAARGASKTKRSSA